MAMKSGNVQQNFLAQKKTLIRRKNCFSSEQEAKVEILSHIVEKYSEEVFK